MIENISSSKNLTELPSFVAETKLFQHFANEAGSFLIERESYLDNEKYFLTQAESQGLAGFGRGPTKRNALVKAIAELYERRLMKESFISELSFIPKALQTSNGFAVHLIQDQASQAAQNEAIERHLLQYSYLKDGWNGFELIKRQTHGDEELTLIASRYSINGLRAGMALANSKRFPGLSFGYFVDKSEEIENSARWSHAIHECVDKIEPFLKFVRSPRALNPMPIEQGILNWMMKPIEKINFVQGGIVQLLPTPSLEIKTFDLSKRWNLDFPLFGSFCFSKDLLPLLVVDRLEAEDLETISKELAKFGLPTLIPERNPVL